MDEDLRGGWGRGGDPSPRIVSVDLRREGETISATARLESNGRSGEGNAGALATKGNYLRVAAEATLRAVAQLNGDLEPAHLGALRIVPLDGLRVVVVRLVLLDQGVERNLVGCAPIRSQAWDAAAAAVLDAADRLPVPRAPLTLVASDEEVEYEIGEEEA